MSNFLQRLDRLSPRFAFARRIPKRQIAIRLGRQIARRLGLAKAPPPLALRLSDAALPTPPIAPRPCTAERRGSDWSFEFLGRSIAMTGGIDWLSPSTGRADQLWRMNLHYMEWLANLSPEDGLAAIRDWIDRNPPGASDAAGAPWNAYALSIRVVEWLRFLARTGEAMDEHARMDITASLAEQLAWLLRWPETDIGGNHLVRNARAMLWAAACTEGAGSVALLATGKRLLDDILAPQILADGTHFELSPSYHCQVLGDLIDCRAALLPNRHGPLDDTIDRMLRAAEAMTHSDGLIAQFGDSGLHMAPAGAELADALGRTFTPTSRCLPDGGFASWQDGRLGLVVRIGAIAAETLPAHAHADAGSLEVSLPGRRILVDQGVFVYVAGPQRAASRSAKNHNVTVAGDGAMADFFGDFRLGRRPSVIGFAEAGADGLIAQTRHDGFRDDRGPLPVLRRIDADGETILIVDRIARPTAQPVRTSFLLHPDCSPRKADGGIVIASGPDRLYLTGEGSWVIEPAVWWPDMGREVATSRLVCEWLPANTETAFTLAIESR